MTKKNSGKAPSYQMYPRDWNENQRLKMCSYAAQGLWIRLCNTSFFMPKPGVFLIENHSLSSDEIIDLLPGKTAEKRKLFSQLSKWNVIKNDGKSFYCKRIMQDCELSRIRKEAGKKGGNPNLVGGLLNQKPNQSSKQKPTPSTSTSFSTSTAYLLKLNISSASFYSWMQSEFCIETKRERGTFTKYARLYAGLASLDKNFNGRMCDKLMDMKVDAKGDKQQLNKMFIASINNEIKNVEIK